MCIGLPWSDEIKFKLKQLGAFATRQAFIARQAG